MYDNKRLSSIIAPCLNSYRNASFPRILIIDGHNFLYRAFYGVPQSATLPNGIQNKLEINS